MNIACPACASRSTETFLQRTDVPVHQNLLCRTAEAARAVNRGHLRYAVCGACGFVFNHAFDPARLSYGSDYDNSQDYSAYFSSYVDELAARIVHERGLNRHRIVEVGCGKGAFIRRLVEAPESTNEGFGFDPSYVGPATAANGRLHFERRFYGPDCAELRADAVVCRHVIEHVPAPMDLLDAVGGALRGSPAAWVFFETPCVDWILRHRVVWDFFYEHCSLFSAASLHGLFERAGFRIETVRHQFGDQYLWLEARPSPVPVSSRPAPGATPELARAFGQAETRLVADWRQRVRDLRRRGKVALWGAGAKGVSFANLVDPDGTLIDCLVDLNPNKQNRFVPGTAHPIVGHLDLVARGIRSAILMNPNYRQENERLLRDAGCDVELIDH